MCVSVHCSGESSGGGGDLPEDQDGQPAQPVPVSEAGTHSDTEGWMRGGEGGGKGRVEV